MTPIGEFLRRRRVEQQRTLSEIAEDLKISSRFLEAIEREQYDKLPGGVFRKSFVRQYANALGIGESEIATQLDELFKTEETAIPDPAPPQVEIHVPAIPSAVNLNTRRFSPASLGSLAVVLLVMLACALVYSWYQNRASKSEQAGVQLTAPAPAPEPGPVAASQQPSASVDMAALTALPQDDAANKVRVGLTAGEETWISVSTDGKQVYAGLLQPNQTKLLEGSGKVKILIGNAGGLEISLNGKTLGTVGSRGEVRTVELTPGGIQVLSRKAAAPDTL